MRFDSDAYVPYVRRNSVRRTEADEKTDKPQPPIAHLLSYHAIAKLVDLPMGREPVQILIAQIFMYQSMLVIHGESNMQKRPIREAYVKAT